MISEEHDEHDLMILPRGDRGLLLKPLWFLEAKLRTEMHVRDLNSFK